MTRGARDSQRGRVAGFHPATQLVLLACALLLTYGVASPLVPVAVLVASAVGAAVSRGVRFSRWLVTFAVLAGPTLVMIGIVQGLFYPGDDVRVLWSWGAATVSVESLAIAAQLWLRIAAMIAACAVFAFGTDAARTFDGLRALRMPIGVAYVCATATSLIPLLRRQVAQAVEARAARGWDTTRLSTRVRLMPGIIAGLLTASLVQLDQRHDTLVQRGFGSTKRPCPLQDHPDRTAERVVRWAAPVVVVAIVTASLGGWLALPGAAELLTWMGVSRG